MDEILARFWQNLVDRVGGPMSFRLVLQPVTALVIAARAGIRDARAGRPPFLWTFVTDPAQRWEIARDGWRDVARVFAFAILIDAIYQFYVIGWFYPGEAATVAALLAVVPYVVLRGPANRLARRRGGPNTRAGRDAQPPI